jgi:hypothetical protein
MEGIKLTGRETLSVGSTAKQSLGWTNIKKMKCFTSEDRKILWPHQVGSLRIRDTHTRVKQTYLLKGTLTSTTHLAKTKWHLISFPSDVLPGQMKEKTPI